MAHYKSKNRPKIQLKMKINSIVQVGLKGSSSICRRVIQLGANLNSHWSSFSLIFRTRPCNAYFILLVLDLVIGPPILHKGSLDRLIAPSSK